MLFGLNVTDSVFFTGGACYMIAFFSNVWAHLENGKRGSRFPFIMNELYEGILCYEHVSRAQEELEQIEKELKKLPASRYIYDYLDPHKQKPDGMKVNETAVSLYDCLIGDDMRLVIPVIRSCFASARHEKELVWIGSPLDEKQKPQLEAGTDQFLFLEGNGPLTLDRYFGNIENVTVPRYKAGLPVEIIAERAFMYNRIVKEVLLPDSVRSLGEGCFWGCSNLERITLGSGLERIGTMAFRYCDSLRQIDFPGRLKVIESRACFSCSSMEKVYLRDGVESIGDEAFAECPMLTMVVLPDSIREISNTAFHKSRKNLTIVAPLGSVGANYAKKRRIKWVPPEVLQA